MDCQRCQNLIAEVLTHDPAVSVGDREAFFEHLGRCWTCREQYVRERDLTELLQKYGRLSPDTIELLDRWGEVVPDPLRPELEPELEEVDLDISEADIEAGVAKLMAAMKRMDAEEQAEREHLEAVKRSPLTEAVADLRRWMNTLKAHQQPWREQWRRQWEKEGEDPAAEGSAENPSQQPGLSQAHRFRRQWKVVAGLAAAACLALMATVWSLWQPAEPTTPSQQAARQVDYIVELVTASGHQPLALGEPIRSEDGMLALRLGGVHKVVLNHGTTATVTAEPIAGHDAPAWHVDLSVGEVYAEVVPGSRFTVATRNALATITGTKFNINAQDEATELTLLKGSVRFASLEDNEAVDVIAGHASIVAGRSAPTQPRLVDARLATAWARQALPEADQRMAERSLDGLNLLGDMQVSVTAADHLYRAMTLMLPDGVVGEKKGHLTFEETVSVTTYSSRYAEVS